MKPQEPKGLQSPIGIRFSDNDFSCTVRAFIEQLLEDSAHCWDRNVVTKELIVRLFNLSAFPLYLLRQHRWGSETETQQGMDRTEKWLKITTSSVFLGDEVLNYYESAEGKMEANCAFHFTLDGVNICSL